MSTTPAAAGGITVTPARPAPVGSAVLVAAGAVVLLAATGAVLGVTAGQPPAGLLHLLFVVVCAVTGGLVLRAAPGNTVGFLLLGSAACFALYEAYGQAALHLPPGAPAARVLGWPQTWLWVPANALLSAVPVLFPEGRAAPGRRWPLWVLAAVAVPTAVTSALRPGTDVQLGVPGRPNPLGVAGLAPVADAMADVFSLTCGAVLVGAGVSLARRARAAVPGSVVRQQAGWLAWVVAVAALVVLVRLGAGLADADPGTLWPSGLPWDVAGAVAAALLPVGVGVAVVRHDLFDVDRLIGRTVLMVVLTSLVAGVYLAVVTVAGTALGERVPLPASLAGVVVAAVALAPARAGLQRRVDRVLYGDRGDPHAVLTRLGRRLETVHDAGSLADVAATVRDSLRLSAVAVEVDGGTDVVLGELPASPVALPLVAGGERVGRLLLGGRPGEATLGRRDLRLLRDLTPGIAGVVRAVREAERAGRLARDLQHTREGLVLAREEERRRLRRDVHDGLGPLLAGLAMRAETAREVDDPAVVRGLLGEVVEDARTALADVRRLVDGLRPPALDTLGLAGALRAHLGGRPTAATAVAVEVPGPLPRLPAATEVAAYRIAVEAVANVDRHARARTARVTLTVEGDLLVVEVADDGEGGARRTGTGVGLASMAERAAELGGTCAVTDRPGGGTLVRARLPLHRLFGREDRGPDPRPAG